MVVQDCLHADAADDHQLVVDPRRAAYWRRNGRGGDRLPRQVFGKLGCGDGGGDGRSGFLVVPTSTGEQDGRADGEDEKESGNAEQEARVAATTRRWAAGVALSGGAAGPLGGAGGGAVPWSALGPGAADGPAGGAGGGAVPWSALGPGAADGLRAAPCPGRRSAPAPAPGPGWAPR